MVRAGFACACLACRAVLRTSLEENPALKSRHKRRFSLLWLAPSAQRNNQNGIKTPFFYSFSILYLVIPKNSRTFASAIVTDIYFFLQIKFLYRFCTAK
jgi:hypothetical protein